MNKYVQEYERKMADFMGYKRAIYVSSGSTANTILAMSLKDRRVKFGDFEKRNIVVLPSTTWQTSCSPWIREGFLPYFIDVSLENFGVDLVKLNEFLKKNHEKVACVFPTALLGFNINYGRLKYIQKDYPGVCFAIDQCENNFSQFGFSESDNNIFTSTTSTYMGHELQSVEGGFIFTNVQAEYESFLMYRNHGMVRSLIGTDVEPAKGLYENKKVDSRFDFYCLGNNFRNSDIHAFIGLLDFKRRFKYVKQRRKLYGVFQRNINKDRYLLPHEYITDDTDSSWYVPFCIPIICKGEQRPERLVKIKEYCLENSIETRPIISGFLGYQTAYEGMMDEKDYPNSVFLHNNGIYIGLHPKVTKKQILKLTDFLNKI
jgi:CDP-6-deoxy-D-xylo-4-hexulose-3-dehydrase